MGFWERIKALFGIKPAPNPAIKTPQSATKPPPGTVLSTNTVPADDTVPLPGGAAVDLIRLLFSKKDKYTTTMLNSISLSSDMKTLYLIDNGRAIAYDLTVPQGVIVGLLGDQLVVATAVALPKPDGGLDPNIGAGGEAADTVEGGRRPDPADRFVFKVGENSQYSLSYNPQKKALGVIGTGDIVLNLETPGDGDCTNVFTSLDKRGIVSIKREEDELVLTKIA